MLIKNIKKFLEKAVLVTCLASTIAQAVPMPDMAATPINPEVSASMTIDMSSSDKEAMQFQSQTFIGESLAFVMDSDASAKHIGEGMEGLPFAAKVMTAQDTAACVVSVDTPVISKLGNGNVHYGTDASGGMVTDQSVASSFTTYHEMGHCLDFLSSKALVKSMVDAGVGGLSMPGAALTQALEAGGHLVDFNALSDLDPQALSELSSAASENGNFEVGVSLMEVYADLHGTLHVASTTGDFRGFSDFGVGFRLGQDSKMTHSTGLAVAKIFEREIASGFDIKDMQGMDNKQITQVVNDIFERNFYENDQLSLKSEGFKDIVRDMQIKKEIGREASDGLNTNLDRLANLLDAEPSDSDKALFLEMMEKNLDYQQNLLAGSGGESLDALKLLDGKAADFENTKDALGVSPADRADTLFEKNTDITSRDVRTAWRGYLSNAVTKQADLKTDLSSIGDFMKGSEVANKHDRSLEP